MIQLPQPTSFPAFFFPSLRLFKPCCCSLYDKAQAYSILFNPVQYLSPGLLLVPFQPPAIYAVFSTISNHYLIEIPYHLRTKLMIVMFQEFLYTMTQIYHSWINKELAVLIEK